MAEWQCDRCCKSSRLGTARWTWRMMTCWQVGTLLLQALHAGSHNSRHRKNLIHSACQAIHLRLQSVVTPAEPKQRKARRKGATRKRSSKGAADRSKLESAEAAVQVRNSSHVAETLCSQLAFNQPQSSRSSYENSNAPSGLPAAAHRCTCNVIIVARVQQDAFG